MNSYQQAEKKAPRSPDDESYFGDSTPFNDDDQQLDKHTHETDWILTGVYFVNHDIPALPA